MKMSRPFGGGFWLVLYGAVSLLLPQRLRRERGGEMAGVFLRVIVEARMRSGRLAGVVRGLRELGDVAMTGIRLRGATIMGGRGKRARGVDTESGSRMSELRHDVRWALRSWARKPAFALVTIITLALGIGANTTIFTVVDAALLARLPYRDPDQLVMLFQTLPNLGWDRGPISYPNWKDWRAESNAFADLAAFRTRVPHDFSGESGVEQIMGSEATGNLFSLLGVNARLGRMLTDADAAPGGPSVIVLSHGLWQRRYGANPSIIGNTVTVDGARFDVIGVMPPEFDFPSRGDEFWIPLREDSAWNRDLHFLQSIGRLREGGTLQSARQELTLLFDRMRREYPEALRDNQPHLETRREFISSGSRRMLLILSLAVGIMLLVACANLANLMLMKATTRGREIAVRAALGARRGRLLRQLLAEGGLLGGFGAAAGVAVAFGMTKLVLWLGPENLPRRDAISVDARALAFTLAAALVSVVLFALVPALRGSRADLHTALRETGRSTLSARTGRLQRMLVVVQVALALVLLTGAGLLINSFRRLAGQPPGFDPTNVLSVRVAPSGPRYDDPEPRLLFFDQVVERVQALPNVRSAGGTWALPFAAGHASGKIVVEGIPTRIGEEPQVGMYPIHGEFFQTLRVRLLAGRWLSAADGPSSAPVTLVSEGMAQRFWPGQDPIGKRIKLGGLDEFDEEPWVSVVGVVGNMKRVSLEDDATAAVEIYEPLAQVRWARELFVVLRPVGDPVNLVEAVKAQVRAVDPTVPVTHTATMEDRISQSVAQPRFRAFLVACFASLASLLALVGIYGVLAFAVTQRTHEIGVRMTLGADRKEVIRDVMWQGGRLALAGMILGLTGAAASSQLLTGMLFEVEGLDARTYGAVLGVLALGATLACWIPALRASRVDPMMALRDE